MIIGDWGTSEVRIRSSKTGEPIAELKGISDPHCAAFSPDGKLVATGDEGHRIRLWNAETGEEVHPFEEPGFFRGPVALSPDGKTLATCGEKGEVRQWGSPKLEQLPTLGENADARCLAFSPRGELLATGGRDGYLRFYDRKTGKLRRKVFAHHKLERNQTDPRTVLAIAFGPDGQLLVSGGAEHFVRLWEVGSGKMLRKWDRDGFVLTVGFSPDGKLVVAGGWPSDSKPTHLWDVRSGKLLHSLRKCPAATLTFSPCGDEMITAGEGTYGNWEIAFADPKSGKVLHHAGNPHNEDKDWFFSSAVSPEGRLLALGSERGIRLWDMKSRKEIRRIEGPFGGCSGLAFAPDGRTLIASHSDGTVLFWDVSGKAREEVDPPKSCDSGYDASP